MTTSLVPTEIRHEAEGIVALAQAIHISAQEDYDASGTYLNRVKGYLLKVGAFCDPDIARWHAGHKAAIAAKDELCAPAREAEAILKGKRSVWFLAEKAKADEAARVERVRLEAIARAERETKAKELAEAGAKKAAEALRNAPPPVVAMPKAAPVAGGAAHVRKVICWRVVDESKVPDKYWGIMTGMIQAEVQAMGLATDIEGIEVYTEDKVIERGAR